MKVLERHMNRSIKIAILLVASAICLGFGASWLLSGNGEPSAPFLTAQVKRGDLEATISATGTVQPEEVIDVGAQVAGKIVSFGKDQAGKTIDYGSMIEEGTILARIDDSLYAADVAQAKAQLDQAGAGVARAEADLGQMQARLVQAEQDWARAKKLGPSDALARSEYDALFSAHEVAKANLSVGKAAILQAKKSVLQAEATLRKAQQNYDYCIIKSPVKGVIIDRRVNIGQTVVASLNAPSLFLIAKDLTKLQVWVAVNEADIGNIHPGQQANFTVDAYPGELFQGEVSKIRLNAMMTQNVVTYTVEVTTDNSNGKLLPYLTANVRFLVSKRSDVLLVPNAALRWAPLPGQIAPDSSPKHKEESKSADKPESLHAETAALAGKDGSSQGSLWTPRGNFVRSIPVKVGFTDGSVTEVQGDDLKEGIPVVIGEQQKENQKSASGSSPFTPQFFRGGRGGGSQQR